MDIVPRMKNKKSLKKLKSSLNIDNVPSIKIKNWKKVGKEFFYVYLAVSKSD